MTTAEIQQYVYNFLYQKQLPHASICAIMGNITGESSWNPNTIEKTTASNKGFGLCQWTNTKWSNRRSQLEAYGITLQHQCEFLWSELTGENTTATGASPQWMGNPADSVDGKEGFSCSLSDFLAGKGTIAHLTKAFCYCWERPAYETNHLTTTRIPSAEKFNTTMKYTGGSTLPDIPSTPNPPPTPDPPSTPDIPATYTITYHGNGGLWNDNGELKEQWSETVTYGDTYITRNNAGFFVREGYNFVGWNESTTGNSIAWPVGEHWGWSYTRNVTIYAQWALSPSLFIGTQTCIPYMFVEGAWKSATPYMYHNNVWVEGGGISDTETDSETPTLPSTPETPDTPETPITPPPTKTVWIRSGKPEINNPYYNITEAKANERGVKNQLTYFGISTCIQGKPMQPGWSALKNCTGAAWGAFNETWAQNASNGGPPNGFHRVYGDAHTILDGCMQDATLRPYVVYLKDIEDPDNYIPPLGGLIVWSKIHVGYISETTYNNKALDRNTIYVEQSSYGGVSNPGTNPETEPWANSEYGMWAHSKLKRNKSGMAKNCWWFNASAYSGGECLGFVRNPALLYDNKTGDCLGRKE